MDLQQKTSEIEKELLSLIIKHLQENQISLPKAQQLAKDFLSNLPVQNQQDLLNKLKVLGENYEEAKEVYVQEFSRDIRQKEEQALNQMRSAIQQGNIDHAILVAKTLHNTN